ncbi:pentapeptide repeat-containing protein [Nostoc sp. XA010]|uniref:pentapeptide repeat-containing protein n=1 Tax=Nostoc sp. XA010 TaxID=2780407 RepID=UPI001E58663A|nr:pentapeptide repeat-containing protein [Nostoc sp. XA010]MCC5656081.1 pentapeptide repeat-containing protein [Nostoc sp. XA010]
MILTGVNLEQTNLSNAELIGANLQQANLMGTNLNSANLTNACLFDGILPEANKKLASDNDAFFSQLFQRLKHLRSLPPQASQQPFLNTVKISTNTDNNWNKLPAIGLIESSEGTILPEDLYDDVDDETIFGNNSIGE